MMKKPSVAAIILAAGKGTRMKSKTVNKVVMPLAGKPMILHALGRLKALSVDPIIIVVGFAKQSVKEVLGESVLYADQKKRLGTGHAVAVGLKKLPENIHHAIVIYGDDSAFYIKETFANLMRKHFSSNADLTFLTLAVADPSGLGRIIRDGKGSVIAIVEEKDATEEQKKIVEINPACYIFKVDFLKKNLKKIQKSTVTGEYYLTSLIDIALKQHAKVETVDGGNIPWRGVNTKEELQVANALYLGRE